LKAAEREEVSLLDKAIDQVLDAVIPDEFLPVVSPRGVRSAERSMERESGRGSPNQGRRSRPNSPEGEVGGEDSVKDSVMERGRYIETEEVQGGRGEESPVGHRGAENRDEGEERRREKEVKGEGMQGQEVGEEEGEDDDEEEEEKEKEKEEEEEEEDPYADAPLTTREVIAIGEEAEKGGRVTQGEAVDLTAAHWAAIAEQVNKEKEEYSACERRCEEVARALAQASSESGCLEAAAALTVERANPEESLVIAYAYSGLVGHVAGWGALGDDLLLERVSRSGPAMSLLKTLAADGDIHQRRAAAHAIARMAASGKAACEALVSAHVIDGCISLCQDPPDKLVLTDVAAALLSLCQMSHLHEVKRYQRCLTPNPHTDKISH